ncbi:hypothetical protein T484DRAFT_1781114 [Baffinella frigidus]|nr:hypothetical protein T484DRAFT_1781114 [Cryptophyta sp. CCMP2293]
MIWRSGNWARALPVHLLLLPAFFDVSVAPSLCLTAGCGKYAQYGDRSTGRREVCAKHRGASDVDNVNPRCWFPSCGKSAVWP